MLQKEIKMEPLKSIYYLGTQFLIPTDWIIENDFYGAMA